MAAAYYLSRRHEVYLFEKDARLGGHTHTVMVQSSRGPLPVDTGFIVHNDQTYPNFVRLMTELGVERQPSDMSFSVTCRRTGLEYSSRGLAGFFAQRRNLVQARQYQLFGEILRFNREATRLLDDPLSTGWTLGEFLDRGRYSPVFTGYYLFPMASAVWSTSLDRMQEFPAETLVRFFHNHGMLGVTTNPRWQVLRHGSSSYILPLTAPYRERIFTRATITRVERAERGVCLHFANRPPVWFDEVVFACHGNQILPLLQSPTEEERAILGCFHTTRNETVLHTDSALLPRARAARASWNYNLTEGSRGGATVTYHMNRLQSLKVSEDYCVSLNANGTIRPERVLQRMVYFHPLYTREAIAAQSRWGEISGRHHTHFCGAYWFYGFHEDGLNSALRVARTLGADC